MGEATTELAGAHRMVLTQRAGADELRICVAGQEQPLLVVSVSEAGVAVRVSGASVSIEASDVLRLEARRLVLSALQELTLSSGGDAAVDVAGDLALRAREHAVTATLGDVRLRANDDVRLNGERVLMNCE